MQKEEEEQIENIPPPGISNSGFKCYLCALLQILFMIKPFVWFIFNYRNSDDKAVDPTILELRSIFISLSYGQVPSPDRLLKTLRWSAEQKKMQNDVGELFEELYDKINLHAKGSPFHALLRAIFSFVLSQIVTSVDGKDKTIVFEKLNMLRVPVVDCFSLEESMNRFFREETIDHTFTNSKKDEKRCKMTRPFYTLPPVLIIWLLNIPMILVGTKSDLRLSGMQTHPCYSVSEARAVARKCGMAEYMECSAMLQRNIELVFSEALRYAFLRSTESKCNIL